MLSRTEWTLLGSIIAADRITKLFAHALRPQNWLLRYVENTGAGFGIFRGQNAVLALVAFAALVLVWFALKRSEGHERVAILVLAAGIVGNFWDRLQYGFVVDFIDLFGFLNFPVFNLADAAITLSVLYLFGKAVRETYADWQFGRAARTSARSSARTKKK